MPHTLTVVWPDHAFATSDEAQQIATRALSEASKALGVSEAQVLIRHREGGIAECPQHRGVYVAQGGECPKCGWEPDEVYLFAQEFPGGKGFHVVSDSDKTLVYKAWRDDQGRDHIEVKEVEPDSTPIIGVQL